MGKGEEVIGSFWDVINKMVWLNNYVMKEKLKDYKPSEVHCIEYIGKNEDSNVTKLSAAFRMTTGGITKITKKLLEKNFIESYRKPNNKKEIYFRLTKQGEEIFITHEKLHKEFKDRDKVVFNNISEEEFDIMLHFAQIYDKHLDEEIMKLDIDIEKGNCDKF
ncbi:MAG: MarR family transcriptional regulator [Clostridium septicum]|uniref:MarR family transcriptional regulator n=1 Tax=Clostridium septicum TaxID=1504 RepID=UPI00258B5C15|nr:MarR family transcriptional regulator [Clostridium septicum]MDU1314802.1 MarR family transcriptional regulator [Clostridium septicum]